MPANYNVYVVPADAPKSREWVCGAKDGNEASDICKYMNPKLPEGLTAESRWDTRDPDVPTFDIGRLVEKPKDWSEG